MTTNNLNRWSAASLALTLFSAATLAQGRPKVGMTPLAEADGVYPGSAIKVALQIALPDGVHMQSNKPRDPLLIPTRITAAPPVGILASDVLYPPPTDFVQAGQSAPLAVFEQRFVAVVTVSVGKEIAPGVVQLPLTLRYQACDASTCYPPAREETAVTLRVVAPGTPIKQQAPELFSTLRFAR
jgi:DsbC/DsbD-like thiol-disulfide interchange protein